MELEIQKQLRNGTSLQDLIWDYDLQIFESKNYPNLICFDYSVLSPKDEQIVREARGLVLDKSSWEVCCVSMLSFDFKNENLIYQDSKAFVKYDGCLIILYHYQNEWITATRFSVDGDCYVASAYSKEKNIKWNDLFQETLQSMGIDLKSFYNSLDKNFCYSFELCTKFNKNIVVYDEDLLKLIAITNKINFKEINILSSDLLYKFPDLEPEYLTIKSINELNDILSRNRPGYELEGYVVCDNTFQRTKVRNPNFNSLSINENEDLQYIQRLIMEISPVGP